MSVYNDSLNIEIVGLAKNSKYSQVKDSIPPVYFLPLAQSELQGENTFYVRTGLPTDLSIRAIRAAMQTIDPSLPLASLEPLPQQVRENVYLDRMISTLTVAFALLATLLAAIGLYGVLAYSVAQRTREIGIRVALGADRRNVLRLVLRQGLVLAAIGTAVGVVLAAVGSTFLESLLYGVHGLDPFTFGSACALFVVVTLAASYIPALRATKVDPMVALRAE
jgi:ABC-type antimicrobial peptide transport system permease subunit